MHHHMPPQGLQASMEGNSPISAGFHWPTYETYAALRSELHLTVGITLPFDLALLICYAQLHVRS